MNPESLAVLAAFAFAYMVYMKRSVDLEGGKNRFRVLVQIVENKYFFDEAYQWVVDRVVLVFSGFIAFFDRVAINDIGVNGPATTIRRLGIILRLHVTGRVYSYALAMVMGTVGLAIFWWLKSA